MTIIWCMVHEISSMTDRIFLTFCAILCPFAPLTSWKIKNEKKKKKKKNAWRYHFTLGHHKWQSCVVPEIWSMTDRTFSHFGSFFALLPPNNPENQNFEKMKRYIIILHNYTKNHDHILYCSLNIVCDGCNFYFQFWAIFTLLPPEHHKKSKF